MYLDRDGDGVGGDTRLGGAACSPPAGYVAVTGDCDDNDPNRYPNAPESCDGEDNDCDDDVDEGVLNACGTCGDVPEEVCDGEDNDCDGDVDEGVMNACGSCGALGEEVCDGGDNDCDGAVDEGVANACGTCGDVPDEICDGIDNDCDGDVDEDDPMLLSVCILDPNTEAACLSGSCVVACSEGFEDTNDDTADGCECVVEPELCDGLDNDCDGDIDDLTPSELESGCPPLEGTVASGCTQGRCFYACKEGRVDIDADLALGREGNGCECVVEPELCDGRDNDCDGIADEDLLGCGCSPRDEVCDGRDNDCDGLVDEDVRNACGTCGDVPEEVCDGLDNDCDGNIDEDLPLCGCEPSDEVCDGRDNDCDGLVDEGVRNDCGTCGPTPLEVCDGVDNNCNGVTDEISPDLLSSCAPLDGAGPQFCASGTCIYACTQEFFDLNNDLLLGTRGDGCECSIFDPSCTDPGTPSDYDYTAPASFISSLTLSTNAQEGLDLDGDLRPDNALGALLGQLQGFIGDLGVERALNDAINDGSLLLGASWPELDPALLADRSGLDMHLFVLEDADNDLSTHDRFYVQPESFSPGSSLPRYRFEDGTLLNQRYNAAGTELALGSVLDDFVPLQLSLQDIRISSTLAADDTGVSMSGGGIGGIVPVQTFVDGINALIESPQCSCLSPQEPLIVPSEGSYTCARPDASACESDSEQEVCGQVTTACSLLLFFMLDYADFDLNEDGMMDALSVYIRLEAVGTDLLGPVE